MSYLISHPTRLYGPTHFAFPPYSFIWPFFYEIFIEYPPYSFIWHLRVYVIAKIKTLKNLICPAICHEIDHSGIYARLSVKQSSNTEKACTFFIYPDEQ